MQKRREKVTKEDEGDGDKRRDGKRVCEGEGT